MGDNTVKVTGYEIGCLLGQGTQGCVYKAITRGPERKPVAVKVDLQSTQFYKMMLSLDSGEITNLYLKVVQKSRLSKVGRDNLVTEIGLLKQLKHRFILELVNRSVLVRFEKSISLTRNEFPQT